MSLYIWLKTEKLLKEEKFQLLPTMTYSLFGGITIRKQKGRLLAASTLKDGIQEELRPFVDALTVEEVFPAYSPREAGRYVHKSVKALVESAVHGTAMPMLMHEVSLTVTDLPDAVEFLELFRLGEIRPVPGGSYHQLQQTGDESYAKLQAEVKRLRDANEMHRRVLSGFVFELGTEISPWCFKRRVVEKLQALVS